MTNGNSRSPEPPLPPRPAGGANRSQSPRPSTVYRAASSAPPRLATATDTPALLRSLPSPRALVYAGGALVGLVFFLFLMRREDPMKHIKAFGEVTDVPSVRAQVPADSPGASSFSEGKRAYESRDWVKAAQAFNLAAMEDRRLADARLYQGIALLAQKRPEDAVRAFDAYTSDAWAVGGMPLDDVYYWQAKALCAQGKGFEAREPLNRCIGEGGPGIETCLKALKALENNLLKMPRPKDVPPAFPPDGR